MEPRLTLSRGRLLARAGRLGAGFVYEIRTPKAVARVERGGEFEITAGGGIVGIQPR
jgi:hypothetical protein